MVDRGADWREAVDAACQRLDDVSGTAAGPRSGAYAANRLI
jgi:hypothetical protein